MRFLACLCAVAALAQPGPARAALSPSVELTTGDPVFGAALDVQSMPSIAFGGPTGFVVWYDARTGGIYGSRVDTPALRPLDQGGIRLGTPAAASAPDVACDTRLCLVVWDANGDIYGRRVSLADGGLLDAAPLLISGANGTQSAPKVAVLPDTFFVIWSDGRDGTMSIVGTSVSLEGAVGSPRGTSISSAGYTRSQVDIAASDSQFLAVWCDDRDWIGVPRIYAARISPSGTLLDPAGIPVTELGYSYYGPKVAWDGSSFVIAAATNSSTTGPFFARVDSWGAATLVPSLASVAAESHALTCTAGLCALATKRWDTMAGSMIHELTLLDPWLVPLATTSIDRTAAFSSSSLDAAFDGSRFVVAYAAGHQDDIFVQAVGADGALAGVPSRVSTGPNVQTTPWIAFNGSTYLIVWADTRSDNSGDIWGARFDQRGRILDPDGIAIAVAPTSVQTQPTVASNGVDFLVAWADSRGNGTYDVFAARVAADGTVRDTNPMALTSTPAYEGNPRIASNGTDYLLVWDDEWTYGDIYAARVSSDGVVLDVPPATIAATVTEEAFPSVIWDGAQYLVAWAEGSNVMLSRLSASGARVDVPGITVASTRTYGVAPALVASPSGYLLSWIEGGYTLRTCAVSSVGVPAAPRTLSQTLNGSFGPPTLASDGSSIVVAWDVLQANGSVDLRFRQLDAAGVPLDAADRVMGQATNGTPMLPRIIGVGRDRFAVSYQWGTMPGGEDLRAFWKMLGDLPGQPCSAQADCLFGTCVDGMCCDTPCGGGSTTDCQACSVAAGAAVDGVCGPVSTTHVCRPAASVCDAPDTCDGASLTCPANAAAPDGTACDDGSLCTRTDSCRSGQCVGGDAVVCEGASACYQAGVCDPATGTCGSPSPLSGTRCSDGDACTSNDSCRSGVCAGTPFTCTPSECQMGGSCREPGACVFEAVDDGTPCSIGVCVSGRCRPPGAGGAAASAGAGGTGGSAGAGAGGGGAGSSGCGCETSPDGTASFAGVLFIALALAARRSRRKA